MEHAAPSTTQNWSFDRVIERLKQKEQVEGLLVIGSLARNALTPASDYDLVIFLRGAPRTWYVGVTTIANRFTDLLIVDASALQALRALAAPVSIFHELGPVIRWLKNGVILFDRSDQVAQVQQKEQEKEWVLPLAEEDAYAAWSGLNFNLAVAKRMASSADPLYQAAVSIRIAVYGPSDLWFGYFSMRKLDWDGDKAAVRYLQQQDPAFLEAFQRFIHTVDLQQKLLYYEQAAQLAAAPLGGIWTKNITVMNTRQTLHLWQDLLKEDR